jgi:bZIP transcription factor
MVSQEQYILPTYPQQQAMLPSFLTEEANNSIESLETSSMSDASWQTPPPEIEEDSKGKGRRSNVGAPKRRNVGGRKPNRPSNLSPEEEEKRRVRRERNKQAAARCRRRREDFTYDLQKQVDDLEEKKRQLTADIQQISQVRDELCELIEEHKRTNLCVLNDRRSPMDVKPKVAVSGKIVSVAAAPTTTTTLGNTTIIQRPTNFVTTLSNNNNNSNVVNANNNKKLSLKIKDEPLEELYDDEPPTKKRCEM